MISSPTATFLTALPTSSTRPARSLPCPEGNVAGHRLAKAPSRIAASPGLIPAALIRTRTWLGPGTGRSTSTTRRTSIPPYRSNLTARGMGLLLDVVLSHYSLAPRKHLLVQRRRQELYGARVLGSGCRLSPRGQRHDG